MHDQAENGIAAHWHYTRKKGTLDYIRRRTQPVPYNELIWVQELARWQNQFKDNKKIPQELELDFFSDRIFVYTPKGDVRDLPLGATPIDFAYTIHSDIGNAALGAKTNGKMVELSHPLKNGDIVEIIVGKNKNRPKRDWLNFVKTSLAKSRIRNFIKNT